MFKYNFILALNYLRKRKSFTIINLLGLTLSIVAFLLIQQYIGFEKSFDEFNQNADNIYRVQQDFYRNNKLEDKTVMVSSAIGAKVFENIPEVKGFTRLKWAFYNSISIPEMNKSFSEDLAYYADSSFLKMFSFPIISGNPDNLLKEPNTAILTESIAKKYFNGENPVGKKIMLTGRVPFTVTAVCNDVPENSHFNFNVLLSFSTLKPLQQENLYAWTRLIYQTYFMVEDGSNPEIIEAKLNKYVGNELIKYAKKDEVSLKIKLQALKSIHLYSNATGEFKTNGNYKSVNYLSVISIFILIIAWINYISLSTAQSIQRAKEVGLRKSIGASFKSLMLQFLSEAFILSITSLIMALLIVYTIAPYLSQLTDTALSAYFFGNWQNLLVLTVFMLAGTVLAGSYPAFVLSSYSPINAFKVKSTRANTASNKKVLNLRETLVVVQFVVSFILITTTFVMSKQLSYMRQQDLGFDTENILVMKGPKIHDRKYQDKLQSFSDEVVKNADISYFSSSTDIPGKEITDTPGGTNRLCSNKDKKVLLDLLGCEPEYFDLYRYKFVAGSNFIKNSKTLLNSTIINETARKALGFESTHKAIGKQILIGKRLYTIVGIVDDFHQRSLNLKFESIGFFHGVGTDYWSFKLSGKNRPQVIEFIKAKTEEFFPGNPYTYFFIDEYFNRQYKADERLEKIFNYFSVLAIIIACLGLIGLSKHIILYKTKEIGIRKVNGAKSLAVLMMLNSYFIRWIVIAFTIACPIAYYMMSIWLENFAFKTTISWWIFMLTGILVLIVALLTVSWQTWRAARRNPVEALRYE